MSDKNHLGQTNTFAKQDRWSGEIFGLNCAKNGSFRLKFDRSGKLSVPNVLKGFCNFREHCVCVGGGGGVWHNVKLNWPLCTVILITG